MDGNNATIDQLETTVFSFDKPLSPAAAKTLDLLTERYTDEKGQPLVKFETDSLVTLHIPRQVRPMPVVLGRAS